MVKEEEEEEEQDDDDDGDLPDLTSFSLDDMKQCVLFHCMGAVQTA